MNIICIFIIFAAATITQSLRATDDVPICTCLPDITSAEVTNTFLKAMHGDSEAMIQLSGYAMSDPTNHTKIIWLKKLSDFGNVTAKYNLAFFYQYNAKPPDFERAMELYRELAKKGDGDGMRALAEMYQDGTGVERSTNSAIQWYEKAAWTGKIYCMEVAANRLCDQKQWERAYVWARVAAWLCTGKARYTGPDLTNLVQNLSPNTVTALNRRAERVSWKIPVLDYTYWF